MFRIVCSLLGLMQLASPTACGADYDIYLLAGQSNMDGRGDVDDLSEIQRRPFRNAMIFYRNRRRSSVGWQPLTPGYSVPPKYKAQLPSHTFGPEIGFALGMLKAQPNVQLALIKVSEGGTSLREDWKPGLRDQPETQGPCYRNAVQAFRDATQLLGEAGRSFKLRALLWHQGEADSKSREKVYQKRLLQLVSRVREDTGELELPVVVGEVFDNGKRDTVRAAQRTVGNSGPKLGFVSAEGTRTWDEGTHFDGPSQLLLGQRYAAATLKLLAM